MHCVRSTLLTFVLTGVIHSAGMAVLPPAASADELKAIIPSGHYQGPLILPDIVRYETLPMRMNLEPDLKIPRLVPFMDPRYRPLFDRVLRESDDSELLELAAMGLARQAREQFDDISPSADILKQHMLNPASHRLRLTCADALAVASFQEVAPDLLLLARSGDDSLRLVIEPALARWKFEPAAEMWHARLGDRFATRTAIRLACEGLAAVNGTEAVPQLISLLQSQSAAGGKRLAAAAAVAQLDADQALQLSRDFRQGTVFERMVAAELLKNSSQSCTMELSQYCTDTSDGVAASAWTALERLDPETLLSQLQTGREHNDAMIRMVAARVMRVFPDSERCQWLDQLISDRNIEVRNTARQALERTAVEQPDLKLQIVTAASDKISRDPADWEGIEQSLLLLGQLSITHCAVPCVRLLRHDRAEVAVTAAWLLHLFPDESVTEELMSHIELTYRQRSADPPELTLAFGPASLQLAYLIHIAGLHRQQRVQPQLEQNFNKGGRSGLPERGAAMWAIGLIHQNQPNTALGNKFVSRIQDRTGMPPEEYLVRQMSVLALGMMRATEFTEVVEAAYTIDSPISGIPEAARWSLLLLGKDLLPPHPDPQLSVGGWKLNPTGPLK